MSLAICASLRDIKSRAARTCSEANTMVQKGKKLRKPYAATKKDLFGKVPIYCAFFGDMRLFVDAFKVIN